MESKNHNLPLHLSDFPYSECLHQLTPAGHVGHANSVPPRLLVPSYQWVNGYHRHPTEVHEAIWRQMEKEKIRQEIIAEDNARRHILEAEVRRELMIERSLAMHGSDGSIYTSRLRSINVDPKGFPALAFPPKIDGMPVGELSGMSALVRDEFGSHPSSQKGEKQRTLMFMPPSDIVKEKQKVILLAKPESNISGMKRKAEVLPSVSGSGAKKKVKEEWSCAVCQVTATSEQALNEHIQGKRHKAKEAGLRKNGKNFSIGLFPKKILMPNKLLEIPSSPCLQKGENIAESANTLPVIPAEANAETTETNNYPSNFRSQQLDQTVKNNAPESRTRENNFKFWCEMCQKGAFSEKVMEAHRKGKRHIAFLFKQKTVGKPSTQVMAVKQEVNLTEEAGEVVKGAASRDSSLIINEVKLDGYQKEAGEDGGGDIQAIGFGGIADEVELEGEKNRLVKMM